MKLASAIASEVRSANARWGRGVDLGPETWLAVLVEEVGEVARDVLERRHDHLDQELAQVAAVAIRWMEARR